MEKGTETYWFTPKRHGYGATPSHWKGWLVTFAFVGFIALASIAWLQTLTEATRLTGIWAWALLVVFAVWMFCRFARTKTDAPWGWRWNGKLYRDMFETENRDQ